MIISKFFMRQEVLFLLKILIIVLSFSAQAFTKNIILDCDVTLVGIDGKEMASNDSEVIDINLKAKTIFFWSRGNSLQIKE